MKSFSRNLELLAALIVVAFAAASLVFLINSWHEISSFLNSLFLSHGQLRIRWILLIAFLSSVLVSLSIGEYRGRSRFSRVKRWLTQVRQEYDEKLRMSAPCIPVEQSAGLARLPEVVANVRTLGLRSDDHERQLRELASQIRTLTSRLESLSALSEAYTSPLPTHLSEHPAPRPAPLPELAAPALGIPPVPTLLERVRQSFPGSDFFESNQSQFYPKALDHLDSQMAPDGRHVISLSPSTLSAADCLLFRDCDFEFLIPNPLGNRFSTSLRDLKEGASVLSALYGFTVSSGLTVSLAKVARLDGAGESSWVVAEKGSLEGDL